MICTGRITRVACLNKAEKYLISVFTSELLQADVYRVMPDKLDHMPFTKLILHML